jgi:nucleotide-binding universal stress UspA family protein
MYRKFLIAIDGSELAGKAIDQGLKLAKETNASVVFCTVTEMWSPAEMANEAVAGLSNPVEAYEQMAKEAAQKILDGASKAAKAAGVNSESVHVSDKAVAEGIVETTDARGCDLVVMATHGRRGIGRLLLGSETTEVLHYSKVPVLVVR